MGMIHARALSRVRSIRLGLASNRADALATAASSLSADATYSSYEEAIADPDVAAVVIATTPPSHPALIAAAAVASKRAIFSEKPLGYSVAEIAPVITELRNNGATRFMSGFMRRWDEGYLRGRSAVDSGEVGVAVALKCTSGDPRYPEKYRRPGAGAQNAMLKDLAVHDIDLARWLLQSEVKRVYATCAAMSYPELANFGDSDIVMAVLEMESGARVSLHLSRALDYGYNVTSELVCTKGSVQMGELKQTSAVVLRDGGAATDIAPAFPERFAHAFERQMEAFAKLVLIDSDDDARKLLMSNSSYASVEDGMRVTEVAEALITSSKTGVSVKVVRGDWNS
jgi:predicted dehydrogenase